MMSSHHRPRRTVFGQIAQQFYVDWPTYELSPLFDRSSLTALESDVRLVAEAWRNQDETRQSTSSFTRFRSHTSSSMLMTDTQRRYAQGNRRGPLGFG